MKRSIFIRTPMSKTIRIASALTLWSIAQASDGADPAALAQAKPMYDLSKQKVLYCVGYAHLDTQWRWDYPTTIDRFIRDTLDQNFALFEKYPGYVFNFTGSVRYQMMKEYYPARYEKLKQYIADGKWYVSGSSVDEGDANVPSAESIIRQVLYGNEFFRDEFGKESRDFMLPDCFGFPASMPSIWAHCGLLGFSTQKLTWGSAVGIPFKIGVWEGPDGRSVMAALDPGPYSTAIQGRVDTNNKWAQRIDANGQRYGVWADYHYYGVGDQGGAPREKDVQNYLASVDNPDSEFLVALVSSDQMYKDITPAQRAQLPRYKGDLLLTQHSAGTLSSQAYMKRWNRKGEQLADAAERAAVLADWTGGAKYPQKKMRTSWTRLLANQMHDILPGTSIPRAYTYSWNDEIIAMNGFAATLTSSVGADARLLDTRVQGTPLMVYNPLAIEREDAVEAEIHYDGALPKAVRVFDSRGAETPSQELTRTDHSIRLLFIASAPSVGLSVYDVRPARSPFADFDALRINSRQIENAHYRVTINDAGDVASVFDKDADRELLARPAQLVFTHERPQQYPAWNMDWTDRQKPPTGAVDGPATVRIIERGPVRVSLEIEREARDSIVRQRLRLTRGDAGRVVEFDTHIDWQTTESTLKASFPLTVSNFNATYNWGLGTIQRGDNDPTKYEVPSHEWFDLTDDSGDYGVSILEDSKFGSDKPTDNEVRLTLLYTPGVRQSFLDQHSQDWGRHDILYALYGHTGDWRTAQSEWRGRRLNQPMRVFQTSQHDGTLGKRVSIASVSTRQVDIRAIKKAEHGDWIIVRLQELSGKPAASVRVEFVADVAEAHEVDGQERRIGDSAMKVVDGQLAFDMTPYSPRSFAVRLAKPASRLAPIVSHPLSLPFNVDVVSRDSGRADGAMDADGRTYPAEQLSRRVVAEGIRFNLGGSSPGEFNAVACRGQSIALPENDDNRVYLLAAATEDVVGVFHVGDAAQSRTIQAWTGFIGQWDNRLWDRPFEEIDYRTEGNVTGFAAGYIKRAPIAWFSTHRHHPTKGNEPYQFSYLFKYELARPKGATTLRLPGEERIKVFAITTATNPNAKVRPAAPLYDDFSGRTPLALRHVYPAPPPAIFDGVEPSAKVRVDRADSFDHLSMGPPTKSDDIDRSTDHDFVFRYFDGQGRYRPHPRAGASGDTLPRLNDGRWAQNNDDTARSVWYDNEGRFYLDLKTSRRIERLNTYSWHRSDRAPQYFSLWGSNAKTMPSPNIHHGSTADWTLIAVVDTRELGKGGVHGSTIYAKDGAGVGPYRHLLWITQDVGNGTFFSEIDLSFEKDADANR